MGRPSTAVAVGVVLGLTWSAGLRAWMAQLAGDASAFSWLTAALVLLPGAAVGGLLGRAAERHAAGVVPSGWLVLAPALFATALLDPALLSALVRTGEGGGALAVVATALSGGVVLSRRRWSLARVLAGAGWTLGMLLLTFVGTMAAPVTTARGAWVCLLGGSLALLLSLAAGLPHRSGTVVREGALPWVGAVAGLAWAGALRGFMSEVVGEASDVSWLGTFGWVLLPGAAVGGLLGWAELRRRQGRPRRVLAWSPLLFVAVLLPGVADLGALLEDGVGGGAVGVPLIVIAGAYALAARHRLARVPCAVVFVAALAVWAMTASSVGGPELALGTPRGAWATLLFYGLLVTGALAASMPLRAAPRRGHRGVRPGAAPVTSAGRIAAPEVGSATS